MNQKKWEQVSKRVWKIELDITKGKIVQVSQKGNSFYATSYTVAHGRFGTFKEASKAVEQYENEMLFILEEEKKSEITTMQYKKS